MAENPAELVRPDAPAAIVDWQDKHDLIRRTVAAGATNDELELFFHQARRAGLDPLAKQIYYVKRKGKGTIQVGIDGLRLTAQRTGQYAGSDDAQIEELEGQVYPTKATVTVYRMVGGQRCPFTATARWKEYYPGDDQGFQWKKMPCAMLSKCAEALALRKGFPAEMSGLYTHEEMDQAGKGDYIDAEDLSEPKQAPEAPSTPAATAPAKPAAKPEAKPQKSDTAPDGKMAFGYVPIRWPLPKMFQDPMTDSQAKMMAVKARERSLPEEDLPTIRRLVLESYGVEDNGSKAVASLFIDWIINADEEHLDLSVAAVEFDKEDGGAKEAVITAVDDSPRAKFEAFCLGRKWPTFANGEGACRNVFSERLGRKVAAPQDLTDADWDALHKWALNEASVGSVAEPASFKLHRVAEEVLNGK